MSVFSKQAHFVRTDKKLKAINNQHRKLKRTKLHPNTTVRLEPERCPKCRKKTLEKLRERSRLRIDLKFSKTGVKKWITRMISGRYRCLNCKHQFSSENLPPVPSLYGPGLMNWCIYFNVVCGQNMLRVVRTLGEMFEIFLNPCDPYRFKSSISGSFHKLNEQILRRILRGPVIHIDETEVKLRGESGYVWVLTSLDSVYYFYRPSREASFLPELFAPFSGVIISDFFTGYDSLDFEQQKCLIHLVREMDDDLLRNPFDKELQTIAQSFGTLLKSVIQSVDRYGLKKRHLRKHKSDVARFLKATALEQSSSESAQKYQKRFEKYGGRMFTFLDFD